MKAGTPNGSTKIRILIQANLYFSALYHDLNVIDFLAQKGYDAPPKDIKLTHSFNSHLLLKVAIGFSIEKQFYNCDYLCSQFDNKYVC